MEKTACIILVLKLLRRREDQRTCGCIITLRGFVVGWTPIAVGARGRARCRNDSVAIAIFARIDDTSWRVISICRIVTNMIFVVGGFLVKSTY